jgi:hypothetical protein
MQTGPTMYDLEPHLRGAESLAEVIEFHIDRLCDNELHKLPIKIPFELRIFRKLHLDDHLVGRATRDFEVCGWSRSGSGWKMKAA